MVPCEHINDNKLSLRFCCFKIGDIVVVKEDNVPPAIWPLGKIIESHPGEDHLDDSQAPFKTPGISYNVTKCEIIGFCNNHEEWKKSLLNPCNPGISENLYLSIVKQYYRILFLILWNYTGGIALLLG
ncbi:hypothetical protein TNCT_296631 [Trichonephila clavata]|uniref:DUF5641 domain-containing protein n=1 Tax=Trichonephila clavata TaxID=2740835 RepID=A0A8X6FP98_TRICU|nr:hypothetical protein TNCT_296631 [Trichonephila clavata]